MKFRRQIQGRSICSENNGIYLIALRKLNHLVKMLPVTVKGEFELHILDLVICQHLTLHLRLEPCDIERLFQIQRLAPCIASTFLFRIGGEEIRCTLRHIEGYDPSAASTRCTFTRLPNG